MPAGSGVTFVDRAITAKISGPVGKLVPATTDAQRAAAGNVGTGRYMNFLLCALAFASEIAQQAAFQNMSEDTQTWASLTGSVLEIPTVGRPTYAFVQCASPPTGISYKFGSSGALMLGHYAWEYNGFFGPLKYLNASDNFMMPELSNVTGLYLMLKPGVSVNLTMGYASFDGTALTTVLGQIQFAAGRLAGFF
jgi:hypothetical protein